MAIEREQPQSEPGPDVRFEATLHLGPRQKGLEQIPGLDLDRIPDPEGRFRVVITAEEAARLVQPGYEVHLLQACPVRPFDRALVASEGEVRDWFEQRVEGTEAPEES